ncbi:MAG: cysteine protease StiP family protein [Eubacterium sp.]|nr:cysteine protease StiP family protein [Eubacterium sp.]
MRSTYRKEDVVLLLKDITGLVTPQPAQERERLIQSGRHYCEMLPVEYVPTQQYMQVYEEALRIYALPVARAVAGLAEKIMRERGPETVLVSLARAGIAAGILLKWYLGTYYHADAAHYAVSIIRGRGIDRNAMRYLLARYEPRRLLFVDGWIGKGAILKELQKEMAAYPGVSPQLAVLADPARVTELYGTREDILIPSSCLNSTVSGLISRTFLRSDIIGPDDFHGAVYYGQLKGSDLSYAFLNAVGQHFPKVWAEYEETCKNLAGEKQVLGTGMEEASEIARAFQISDVNLVKPGIGETTRVLLRRVPWQVLVDARWKDDQALRHIFRLAQEKDVPVVCYPLKHYKCCGLIQKLPDI